MEYTIKEVSHMMSISTTTLRYYDKEGLLPYITRRESGYRVFSDSDVSMLHIIHCLKKSGLSIKDIKKFIDYVQQGDDSLEERYQLFLDQREQVKAQIADLHKVLDTLNHKCWYYETAIAAGTEAIHKEIAQPLEQAACDQ